MSITDVGTVFVARYLFVLVRTDKGITGWESPAPGATSMDQDSGRSTRTMSRETEA